jgi:hypothetical protein
MAFCLWTLRERGKDNYKYISDFILFEERNYLEKLFINSSIFFKKIKGKLVRIKGWTWISDIKEYSRPQESMGIWFQGDHHGGKTMNDQDAQSSMLWNHSYFPICRNDRSGTCNLKPHGVGLVLLHPPTAHGAAYITITRITVVWSLLTKAQILFHALYLEYCECLIHFPHKAGNFH